jgi:hypothetical protein
MNVILTSLLLLETIVLAVSCYYNYKFGRVIIKIEDALEDSLDLLDKRYESMSKILQIPLFFDSPEIKRAVEDIRKSRDAILYVANTLTNSQDEGDVNAEGNEEGN